MVAQYRISGLSELARSMAFTPSDTRWAQTAAAEQLLHEINPIRSYPLDFVIFRITNYRPAMRQKSELLTGHSLQHDLGLLIEQASASLAARPSDLAEPVLSIADVCERFGVTSKTIQRWRRKGLPGRRFLFPDGRLKVGFLLSSVERFIARQQSAEPSPGSTAAGAPAGVDPLMRTQPEMLQRARRLARAGCWPAEIARQIGKRTGRSPLAVLHTIRKHDQEHPESAVFPLAAAAPTDLERARILRGHRRGLSLGRLARRVGRPRRMVARIILQQRATKLGARKLRFIDDPLYHGELAEQAIAAIAAQDQLPDASLPEDHRLPRDLPPYLRELYRIPLLSAAAERALFLKFNFHKFQFVAARRRLDPQFATARQLDRLEAILSAATAVKNDILRANLRLVVSVARKHVRPGLSLMELVSEGNLTLMRAVDSFDTHKGNRFSTYATLALMKGFARSVPAMLADRLGGAAGGEQLGELADPRLEREQLRGAERDRLWSMLEGLDERECRALVDHFDLDASPLQRSRLDPADPDGESLAGTTAAGDRQLRRRALAKLRHDAGRH